MYFKYQKPIDKKETKGENHYEKNYLSKKDIFTKLHPFEFVEPTNTVVSCGARGDLCMTGQSDPLVLSTLAKHVIVIEAEPKNTKMLKKYIKRYDIKNITIINKIIWDKPEKLDFICYPRSAASRVGKSEKIETNKYNSITLNEVREQHGKIDYLHLTVNGAEENAILGAKTLIEDEVEVCIAFLGRNKEIFESRIRALLSLEDEGYNICWANLESKSVKQDRYKWKASSDDVIGRMFTSKTNMLKVLKKPVKEWSHDEQYGFMIASKDKEKIKRLGFRKVR